MTDETSPTDLANAAPTGRRPMIVAIVALSVLAPLAVMALYVDDWSRDLTTNQAHTAPGARSEPWLVGATAEELATAAEALGASARNWRLEDAAPLPADSPLPALIEGEAAATHHFVRTTGLMRYEDDVWLVATDAGEGQLRLYAESRSRVGKGDLGQNPRNLRELRSLLDAALAD